MKKKNNDIRINLIEAGLALFSKNGYHGTGIKEIVDSQGIPKGSFYNYFKSKEDFTSEIVGYYAQILDELWDRSTSEGPSLDPVLMLQNTFEQMISLQEGREVSCGCLIGNLAGELAESSEICRLALNKVKRRWCERISFYLEKGQLLGSVRKDIPAEDLAGFCWDLWEGALLRMKIEKSTESIRKTITMLFKNFIRNC